ncbi:hypothetical protein H2203_000705 [Taxawa tesnikishii (nom. ined.)]|nr:hypothetical protein H2203_000705 [Dothideales sp. JES 119]
MGAGGTSGALYAVVSSPFQATGREPEEAKELRHHAKGGKGFINPWDSYIERGGFEIGWAMINPDTTPPTIPVRKPEFLPTRETPALRATWLGHACYYVEFPSGFRVLFDPVFTERCSPFTFMGPKRYTEMPCKIEDIPYIDAVVISHSHYDHLSHPTVTEIAKKHPNVHFFVPLKNKQWFEKCGIHNVTELDWWQSREIKLSARRSSRDEPAEARHGEDNEAIEAGEQGDISATLGCLPCQHTSARTPFDKSHTLWASWSVESGGKKIWFGGDTGYRAVPELPKDVDDYDPTHNFPACPAFKQIGDLRGPLTLA